jgi:hypothetical protein
LKKWFRAQPPPPSAPNEPVGPGFDLGRVTVAPPQTARVFAHQRFWLGLAELERHVTVIGTTGTITQDAADFLRSDHGRAVLVNAEMKLLLKQDSTTVDAIAEAFELTPEERQYLLGASKGEGLLFARGGRLALSIEASPAEHRLATTAPRELAELAAHASENRDGHARRA